MPIIDLSQVTEVLMRLLERYIFQPLFSHLVPSNTLITGDPPDMLAEHDSNYVLSLYLYHVQEDEYHKNQIKLSSCDTPVRYQELALNLFYLLTAFGGRSIGANRHGSPYGREQTLMGLAMKAFHDYPVVDAKTEIITDDDRFDGASVFPPDLSDGDDEFRLELHPATSEEINKVWTAATVPMRLSAIYQVRVVFMKAEEPSTRPVPVLLPRVGVGNFQPLWIEGIESECTFTIPGETSSRTMFSSPALVAVGEPFWIKSRGFSPGTATIFLSTPAWTDIRNVDVTDWMARERRSDNRIEMMLPRLVSSPAGAKEILPGFYQICLQQGDAISNLSPLMVASGINSQTAEQPGIDPAAGSAGSSFSIYGGPFSGEGIHSVEICIGTRVLDRDEGEFTVFAPDRIDVNIADDLRAGVYLIRVVVNCISTLPIRWFEVVAGQ
ncbi:MAG: hypothetical protein A4E49_00248 [Methanosaeta sp. PtaU1.Bin112]|nr:MAG: hypothetical protein A4E49_00248 [Methanosaeta sp. PtaU1.Bin112]